MPLRRALLFIAALCCAGLTPAALADSLIFRAEYASEYSGMKVDITRTLTAGEDGRFYLRLKGSAALASVEEHSIFERTEQGLRPLEYFYKRKIFGIGGREELKFDWQKGEVHYRENGKVKAIHSLREHPGLLDPALYQLQLQIDLYRQKDTLRYHYIHRKKLRDREFQVVGRNNFHLEGGKYEALVVERVATRDDKHTEIWVLPGLFFHTAYIKQSEDDKDTYDTRLKSVHFDAAKLKALYATDTLTEPG